MYRKGGRDMKRMCGKENSEREINREGERNE